MRGNKWKWLTVMVGVGLAALALSACGGGGSSSSGSTQETTSEAPVEAEGTETAKSEETPSTGVAKSTKLPNYDAISPKNLKPANGVTAALVIASTENGGEQSIVEGFEAKAQELGVQPETFVGKSLGDNASQVAAMESAITRKPDFIVLFPGSPSGLNAQVQQARSEGIKVITDLLPSEQEVDLFINSTIVGQAEAAGEAVVEYLNGEGKAWYLLGGAGDPVPAGFEEGFGNIFKKHPGIEVVYKKQFPGVAASEAVEAAEAAVTSHPEVDVVMTDSGESVEGIQGVLAQNGIEAIFTTTSIFTPKQVKEIDEGTLISTSVPFYRSGETGVEWGVALSQGQKPPSPEIELEPMTLTKYNMEEAVNTGKLFESISPKVLKCGGEGQEPCL